MSHHHHQPKGTTIILALLLPLLALGLWGFFLSGAPASAAEVMVVNNLLEDHLRVGISGLPLALDPIASGSIIDGNSLTVINQIYDTLTTYSEGESVANPHLVESWSASPDGMTWIFNLRTGVTFHDGTPLNSAAVVYNIERWWDPNHPQHSDDFDYFKFFFGDFKGSPDSLLADVNAISSYQVELQLTRPNSLLPQLLAYPGFGIASPDALQSGDLNVMPVGSGAYRFVSQESDSVHLIEFAEYWGSGPHIPNLDFMIIEDPATRLASLVSGDIQIANNIDEEALALALDPDFQIIWREAIGTGYLGFNRDHTPLDHDLVRQAIAHAINIPALVASYYSYGDQVAGQLVPPAVWGFNPALDGYTYDPGLASDLLELADYETGFTTTLSYRTVFRTYLPNPADVAEAIKNDLQAIGITVNIKEMENNEFMDQLNAGNLDLFLLGWYADYPHADNFYNLFCQYHYASFGSIDNAFCDDLEAAAAELDWQEQLSLYHAIGQQVHDDLPLLPIMHPREAVVSKTSLAGFTPSLMTIDTFKDTYYSGATQVLVTPENTTTLTYTGSDGSSTTVDVPTGAVSNSLLLRLEPTQATNLPENMGSSGNDFDLNAIVDGETLQNFTFNQPVSITVKYTDDGIRFLNEDSLGLYYWDGETWVPAAQTCQPTGATQHDLSSNTLVTEICHLTRFALLAERYSVVFLPALDR
jgi:peptide/nickel transport system substrate-binding protein